MSRQYYSEINLHLIWHTKNSLPLLTDAVEPLVHRELKRRVIETPGAYVHAIGGTPTHVHLAVTLPPTLLVILMVAWREYMSYLLLTRFGQVLLGLAVLMQLLGIYVIRRIVAIEV